MGAGRDLFGVRKDQTEIPIEIGLNPIETVEGLATLASIIDITERKEAEKKVQEAMNIRAEFTSMVSHELRTPLTTIKSSIGLVAEGAAGSLNADQKDFLETAKRNVDRLARLINNVLDYQKLDAQRMEFHLADNDLNEVILEIQKSFELTAGEKGLSLKAQLDKKLPKIKCDRDKIIQVLTNLVNNAIKFSEKGTITLKSEKSENTVRISVDDQGSGIQEEDISKLFESFSQISTPKGRATGGTGLGLAVSKKIIEGHRGKIGVESVHGKGSSFYFILPIMERRT